MNDEYWGEPGWSPDGDVDDAGGVPESRGGLGGSGLRPITNGIRPADKPTTLSQVVAANVRLEAARVGVTQAGLARLLHTSRSAVSLRYMGRVEVAHRKNEKPHLLKQLQRDEGYEGVVC